MKAALNINRDYVIHVINEEFPGAPQETIDLILHNIRTGNKGIDEKVSSFYYEWIREQARAAKPQEPKFSFI